MLKRELAPNGTNLGTFEIKEDGLLLSINSSQSSVKRDNKGPASFVMPWINAGCTPVPSNDFAKCRTSQVRSIDTPKFARPRSWLQLLFFGVPRLDLNIPTPDRRPVALRGRCGNPSGRRRNFCVAASRLERERRAL